MAAPPNLRRIKVCLLSAHPLVLQEMQRVLNAAPYAIEPTKIQHATTKAEQLPEASVYVVDSGSLPNGALEVVKQIVGVNPDAQILVLGEKFEEDNAFPLLGLGVKGLVSHEAIAQQLTRALEAISSGGFWVPRTLLASFVDSVITKSRKAEATKPAGVEISRREHDIMDGLLMNLSNKEIANRLNIAERTVKFHVSNLLSKFKVQRRADLILLWYQQGHPAVPAVSSLSKRVH